MLIGGSVFPVPWGLALGFTSAPPVGVRGGLFGGLTPDPYLIMSGCLIRDYPSKGLNSASKAARNAPTLAYNS